MPRGVLISFPARLTPHDREGLRRFAAALAGTQIDILTRGSRREIAILALAGRQLWVERDATGLRARDATSGWLLAEDTTIGGLLTAVQAALLPGGSAGWRPRTTTSTMWVVPRVAASVPLPALLTASTLPMIHTSARKLI